MSCARRPAGALRPAPSSPSPAGSPRKPEPRAGRGFARFLPSFLFCVALLLGALGLSGPVHAQETAPSAPRNFTAVPGNNEIALSWEAPASWGSRPAGGYQLQHNADGGFQRFASRQFDDTDSSATGFTMVRALYGIGATEAPLNGNTYSIRIRTWTQLAGTDGSDEAHYLNSAWVTIADIVPGIPATIADDDLTVTPGAYKLDLSWTAPSGHGSAITGYDVHYTASISVADDAAASGSNSSTAWVAARSSGTALTETLTPLLAGFPYRVRVRAKNTHGTAASWAFGSGTPLASPPSAAPGNVVVRPQAGALHLSWTAPGGVLTGYDVHYTSAPVGTVANNAAAQTGGSPSAANGWVAADRGTETNPPTAGNAITGLSVNTAYRVRVRAKNGAGAGPWAFVSGTPAATANPTVPRNVRAVSGNARVTLSWTAPVAWGVASRTGAGYLLQWKPSTGSWDYNGVSTTGLTLAPQRGGILDETITSYTFSGTQERSASGNTSTVTVANGGSYDFRIKAVNPYAAHGGLLANDLAESDWVEITGVKVGLPAAVSSVSVAPSGSGTLAVTWTAPSGNGSSVSGYDVHYTSSGSVGNEAAVQTGGSPSAASGWVDAGHSGTTASQTISGLSDGTRYRVRVRATNTHGSDGWGFGAGTPLPTYSFQFEKVEGLVGAVVSATVRLSQAAPAGGVTIPLRLLLGSQLPADPGTPGNDLCGPVADLSNKARIDDIGPNRPRSVTVASGQTEVNFDYPLADNGDDLVHGEECFALGFGTVSGWAPGTRPYMEVEMSHTTGQIAFSRSRDPAATTKPVFNVLEAEGSARVTVVVSRLPGREVTFPIEVVSDNPGTDGVDESGTATEGTDYSIATKSVTFGPGDTASCAQGIQRCQKTLTVTVATDTAPENDETIELKLSDHPSGSTVTQTAYGLHATSRLAQVRIINDDTAAVALSVSPASVSPGTSATITATLSAAASEDVTVGIGYSVSGSATLGDFTGRPTSVVIEAGETSGTATLTANSNTGGRTGTLTLSLGTITTVSSPQTAIAEAGSPSSAQVALTLAPPVPSAPTDLDVAPGNTRLDLSWAAPMTGGAATGYDVHYTESTTVSLNAAAGTGVSVNWVALARGAEADPPTASQAITGLTNNQRYRVRVRAKNLGGESAWVEGAGTPALPVPQNVRLVPTGASGQLHMSWDKVEGATGYLYQVGQGTPIAISGGSTTSHLFVNLGTNVYAIRVRAAFASGSPSAWSDYVRATPTTTAVAPGVPRSVTATPGDSKVVLNWQAPSSWGSWRPVGFQIQSNVSASWSFVDDTFHDPEDPALTRFVFAGVHFNIPIRNGTAHGLRIRAWSQQPGSDGSQTSHYRYSSWVTVSATPVAAAAAPGAVGALTATPGDGAVNLAWTPPSGEVVLYEVHFTQLTTVANNAPVLTGGNVSSADGWKDAGSSGASFYRVGAPNGTPSRFRVRAKNGAGNGPWSVVTATPVATSGPVAQWARSSVTVQETDTDRRLVLGIALSEALTDAVALSVTRTGGTAAPAGANRDFEKPASGCGVTGATGDLRLTCTLVIKGDDRTESSETIRLALAKTSGTVTVGDRSVMTVTIDDDDRSWEVNPVGYVVPENTTADIRVKLDTPAPEGGLTFTATRLFGAAATSVAQSNANGTRMCHNANDNAYALASSADIGANPPATLTISAGETEAKLRIPIAADTVTENSECFAVRLATTAPGWSASGDAVAEVVIEDIPPPAAPTDLAVTPGEGRLDLTWTAPTVPAGNSLITGYHVHYTSAPASGDGAVADDAAASGSDPAAAWVAVGRSGTAALQAITGLADETDWRVRVRAINRVTPGAWAFETGTTPAPSDPSRPTGLAVAAGDGSLTASWTAPAGVNVARYEAQVKRKTAQDWPTDDTDVAATGTSHVFTGLTAGAVHEVRVRTVETGAQSPGAWTAPAEGTPFATVTLSASPNPVTEGGTASVLATLSAPLAADAVFPLTLTPGTAEQTDYTIIAGGNHNTLTVKAGSLRSSEDSNLVYRITAAQDQDEDDETLTVALGTLPAGVQAEGSTTSVLLTIRDDEGDPSRPTGLMLEKGDGRLTASWTAPSGVDVLRYEVQHRLKTASDWPTTDTDVAGTSTSHVFTGLTARAAYQIRVRTVKPDGTVGLWSAAIEGTPFARATLSESPILVIEGETAAVTVTLSAPVAINTTIPVTVSTASPNTAEAGDVGTLSSITVAAGAASGTGSIATHHDDGDEDETFTVALSALPSGVRTGAVTSATVTIRDDEGQGAPKVRLLSVGPNPVPEGGRVGVTLLLLRVPLPQDVVVPLTLTNGTAEAGDRGTLASVTVPAGRCCATGFISTFEDGDVDDETFTVAIDAGRLPGSVRLDTETPSSVEVTITDNGVAWPEVTIAAGPGVTEGGNAAFTLTADPAPAAALAVTVKVAQSGRFVAASALGPRTVRFAAGSSSASFTVATVDDAMDEPHGSVTAALVAGTRYTLPGSGTTATVRVADNDEKLPLLLVHDGWGTEGSDTAVTFDVALTPRPKTAVTVQWATSDGSGERGNGWSPAAAGSDYTASSGTLTFAAGENRKSFTVPLIDDAVDEGIEYFVVTFSNPQGGALGSAQVLGVIVNDDHLQTMWLSRFGRTVGSQVTDAVTERLEGGLAPGAHMTLAGQPLDLSKAEDGKALADALTGLARAFGAREAPAAGDDDPLARRVTGREFLLGSSFHLAGRGGGSGPGFAAWGRAAHGSFDGEHADDTGRTTVDGKVLTGVLGADAEWSRVLAGVAVSLSEGDGRFDSPGVDLGGAGAIESRLTAVSPYARVRLTRRLSAWGLLGWGAGEMTMRFDDGGMEPVRTDIGMRLGALGARGALFEQERGGGMDLALKADAFFVRVDSEKAVNSAETEADARRLRLALEGGRAFALSDTATFRPSLELGVRHDGGDAESGTGMELGGGAAWSDAATGLSIEARARVLVAHADSEYREWGASASVRLAPGEGGRGPWFSLSPAIGASSSAAERLWGAVRAREFAPGGEFEAGRGLTAEAGYGMALLGGRFTGTPNLGYGLSDGGGREYRIGWRLIRAGSAGFELNLDATRDEPAGDDDVEHALTLRALIRW